MKKPQENTLQKTVIKFAAIAVLLSILSVTASPALASKDNDFLVPSRGYSVDYYRSYGEPTIKASVTGDTEFERGESADIAIKIANTGTIEELKRLNANQNRIPDSQEEAIALGEMAEEMGCTTAKGLKATLTSDSDYIHIEPTTSLQTVDELKTGNTQNLKFTMRIDSDAPGGEYELHLPVTYEYQSNARTETSKVVNIGLSNSEYTREYTLQTIDIPIHISIKNEPTFEISNVSGSLVQGSSNTINITYTNTGEGAAEDAEVRFVVMNPLSTRNTIIRLGTIGQGESRVASLDLSADSDALVKNYSIDSEIKYIDDEGKTELSKNMKVDVPVEQAESRISTTAIILILLAVIVAYMIIKMLRKRNKIIENTSGDEND
ncbi:COG1361 S-layer family protein [Methanosarcina sp. UBA289]|uniref:COG1361 S-layer family protein n=1 Tax=Methanosarcina sp. UBA289 TaxID=1915574 RepID=UPI0025F26D61|nr:hypothetical protein [Methanosarcina sp. UBA289]